MFGGDTGILSFGVCDIDDACDVCCVPIRFTPTATICSVWGSWTLSPAQTSRFRDRSRSSSGSSRTTRPARRGLRGRAGPTGSPVRIAGRLQRSTASPPGVLRCRSCRRDTRLTAGTVMHRSQTPLSTWFWGAHLVVSQTKGLSATQFQRQLSRYESAFGILHKLRAGMARPRPGGKGPMSKSTRPGSEAVRAAKAVASTTRRRWPAPSGVGSPELRRTSARAAATRVRLAVMDDRSAASLCGFVESAVAPGATVVTDDWAGYADLARLRTPACRPTRRPGSDRGVPSHRPPRLQQPEDLAAPITASARSTCRRISMSSPSASTGASGPSTPSAPCSGSRQRPKRRPMPGSMKVNGITPTYSGCGRQSDRHGLLLRWGGLPR